MRPTVLIANPSADTYGADLQMLASCAALVAGGWRVVVTVPASGPLVPRLEEYGVQVAVLPHPVLRRADLSPRGLVTLTSTLPAALARMRRMVEVVRPDVLYVNTITIPWWLVVARRCGVPSVCHVHEAEAGDPLVVRRALGAPLSLADRVIVNSRATARVIVGTTPRLRSRSRLIHNGVAGPDSPPEARPAGTPYRVLVVGRLSPRKAPDVALEAVAAVRRAGRDVELEVCGTAGPGHEGFAAGLEQRAQEPDLRGAVSFTGYVSPVWPALARSDVLVAPSLGESFGNAVVEGQLARRPVIATAVQGHLETVEHGITGFLVPLRDANAIAEHLIALMDDPVTARQVGDLARHLALANFGTELYADKVIGLLEELTGTSSRRLARASV